MSSTLLAIKERFGRLNNDWLSETTTADGGAAGATLICTNFKNYDDDYFNQYWCEITSGTYDGNERKVLTFVASTGVFTPYTAFGGQILSGVTFRLHRYQSSDFAYHINRGKDMCYPTIPNPIRDTTLIGQNFLPNSHFEHWASSNYPDYYRVSVVTAAKETTTIRGGSRSAKVTRVASDGYMYISEAEFPALLDLEDSSLTVYCWAKASSASQSRLQVVTVTQGGTTTTTNGTYHTGGGKFELLSVTATIPDSLANIQIQFSANTTAGDVYYDDGYLLTDTAFEYLKPLNCDVIRNIYSVGEDVLGIGSRSVLNDWEIRGDKIVFFSLPPEGERLLVEGTGRFTDLSADTDTIALNEEIEAVALGACVSLYNSLIPIGPDAADYQGKATYFRGLFQIALGKYKVPTPVIEIRKQF